MEKEYIVTASYSAIQVGKAIGGACKQNGAIAIGDKETVALELQLYILNRCTQLKFTYAYGSYVPYAYGMYQLYAYGIKYAHGTEHYYAKEHSSITKQVQWQ